MPLLEPKQVEIDGKPFVLSKFPATVGREIILQYPVSAMPKVGDYATNEALMMKIMHYVGVPVEGRDDPLQLTTRALVDNNVTNAEMLMKIEWAMMNHNFAFFSNGSLSGILERVGAQAVGLIQKTLTDLSQRLPAKPDGAGQP
jgi:hypothetical protein